MGRRGILIGAVVAVACFLAYRASTNQISERTFEMTWQVSGENKETRDTEIDLGFVEFPGFYITVVGTPLRAYLEQNGRKTVMVEFEVTSNLGCVASSSVKTIDGRSANEIRWSLPGGKIVGALAIPWAESHWWCKA